MSYLDFKKDYKDSIQLNEDQFETICKSYVVSTIFTEDLKLKEMIRDHLISKNQKPINLNPPEVIEEFPIERISQPKPMFKPKPRNFGEFLLKIVKLIENPNLGKGNCIIEMKEIPLFLERKQLSENYEGSRELQLSEIYPNSEIEIESSFSQPIELVPIVMN